MKIPMFPCKYHQNGGFSMAMLVLGRVVIKVPRQKWTNKRVIIVVLVDLRAIAVLGDDVSPWRGELVGSPLTYLKSIIPQLSLWKFLRSTLKDPKAHSYVVSFISFCFFWSRFRLLRICLQQKRPRLELSRSFIRSLKFHIFDLLSR